MISFIRSNNKKSSATRSVLDGLPLPIAMFNLSNKLIYVNRTFLQWFMHEAPNVFRLIEITKQIDLLMSNELMPILNEVLLSKKLDINKEIFVRTSINKHNSLKVSFRRISSDEAINGVLVFFETKPKNS